MQAGLYRGPDGGADRAPPPARRVGSAQAGLVRAAWPPGSWSPPGAAATPPMAKPLTPAGW
ncbi:hypothetical protein C4D60_Mb04t19000 [Musa balbisiana]|uniref:Uncharacterized protein n=1 Tax=Musa balbisiana TaxID=52838 RepID=A0A4S8KD23_MUSBA|nr:hypothetical protein C4D60_Mb04t19000 [Musa balbisiana]